jgi:hypothetical protein
MNPAILSGDQQTRDHCLFMDISSGTPLIDNLHGLPSCSRLYDDSAEEVGVGWRGITRFLLVLSP